MTPGVKQLVVALIRKKVGNGKLSKAQRKKAKLARKKKHLAATHPYLQQRTISTAPPEQVIGSTASTKL